MLISALGFLLLWIPDLLLYLLFLGLLILLFLLLHLFLVLPGMLIFLSITVIWFNGSNYPLWAKLFEVYLMTKGMETYLIDALPDQKDPIHAAWKKEDAQICIWLWKCMEPLISSSLVYLPRAKQLWDRAKEMFYGVNTFD